MNANMLMTSMSSAEPKQGMVFVKPGAGQAMPVGKLVKSGDGFVAVMQQMMQMNAGKDAAQAGLPIPQMAEELMQHLLSEGEWSAEDWEALSSVLGHLLSQLQNRSDVSSELQTWLSRNGQQLDALTAKISEQWSVFLAGGPNSADLPRLSLSDEQVAQLEKLAALLKSAVEKSDISGQGGALSRLVDMIRELAEQSASLRQAETVKGGHDSKTNGLTQQVAENSHAPDRTGISVSAESRKGEASGKTEGNEQHVRVTLQSAEDRRMATAKTAWHNALNENGEPGKGAGAAEGQIDIKRLLPMTKGPVLWTKEAVPSLTEQKATGSSGLVFSGVQGETVSELAATEAESKPKSFVQAGMTASAEGKTFLQDTTGPSLNLSETLRPAPGAQDASSKSGFVNMNAQQFLKEMSELVLKKWQTSHVNGVSEAKIQLVPEHLGQLDVHLKMQNGQLVAQFMADKLVGKEMLESQIALLRTALQNQGIQVEKLEVTHQPAQHGGLFHDQREQQSSRRYPEPQRQQSSYDFAADEWNEEWDAAVQSRRLSHGGTFDATA